MSKIEIHDKLAFLAAFIFVAINLLDLSHYLLFNQVYAGHIVIVTVAGLYLLVAYPLVLFMRHLEVV